MLALGEPLEPGLVAGRRRHHPAVALEDPGGDGGVEPGAAAGDRAYGGDQLVSSSCP